VGRNKTKERKEHETNGKKETKGIENGGGGGRQKQSQKLFHEVQHSVVVVVNHQ